MASSGTELRWAEPGLGKGSRRRRWAWAEAGEVEDPTGPGSWEEEGPLPGAASPGLLEDFHRAQQRPPPLGWPPDPQPNASPDSEPGEYTGEEFEEEDVDSLEDSTMPVHWHDPRPATPDAAPAEAPGGAGPRGTGDSSPRVESEAALSSEEEDEDSEHSPRASAWGQAGDSGGDTPPEHSEAARTADLSPARSWSSGTVSLGPPSDGLGPPWAGRPLSPQPAAPGDSPRRGQRLNPADSVGGSVTMATAKAFQDSSSTPPSPSPPDPAARWGARATGPSCPPPGARAWKRTWASPKALPSRLAGPTSPPRSPPRPSPRPEATLAGHAASSDARKYGRGRLNHPLPDLSKVGPRVRFPKEESYRPPKARTPGRGPQDPRTPLIFKSPAEIVREVLLNSGEAPAGQNPPPTHPIARVPQEFQTPEQATKLVHQLQEDYHRLLTKYAEAENTIDQLRLGAKVNLYSDPPQPSHSIHMGTMSQGTKVLSFTIPQPQAAERWPHPSTIPQTSEAAGGLMAGGTLSPSSSTGAPIPGRLPENQGLAKDQPSAEQTQVLASQARRFLDKVESFAGLMQAGCLTPQDQLKGFQRLKAAHAALEEEYLRACREQRRAPQLAGSRGSPGTFDPDRELEAEIFQLGIRLEELKDRLDQNQQVLEPPGWVPPLDSSPARPRALQPPQPARQTACTAQPEAASTGPHLLQARREAGVDCSEDEAEEEQGLGGPASPRPQERQMEQDFHGLLQRYLDVKSRPEALRREEEEDEEEQEGQDCTLEVDRGPAPGIMEPSRLPSAHTGRSHKAPLKETAVQMAPGNRPAFRAPGARDRHPSGLGKAEAAAPGPGRPPPPRGPHRSSLSSLEGGSSSTEQLARKSPRRAGLPHQEEPWMASPETDSGFVGSETSRVSPLTQTPEHRLAHISTSLPSGTPGTPGTLTQSFTTPAAWPGASHSQTRDPQALRRASEPSLARSRAPRHPVAPPSPLRQRAPSFCLERPLLAETALEGVAGSEESKGHGRVSEKPTGSGVRSPPASPAPETPPAFLLARTSRDQAIRELQEEVSRLRVRLEGSLHRSPQASPARPPSTHERPTRVRERRADSSATWGAHSGSKSTERLSGEPGGAERAVPTGRRPARSSSVPREMPRQPLNSESEPSFLHLSPKKSESPGKDRGPAAPDAARAAGSTRRPDRVTFRGQYTGQQYRVLTPTAAPRGSAMESCAHCQLTGPQVAGMAVAGDPGGPAPPDAPQCPLCGRAGGPSEAASSDSAPSGPEKAASRRNPPAAHSPQQRAQRAASPPRPPPGLWYLAAPSFAYVSSVPVLPYPPAAVYYSAPGSTSAPLAAEWPPAAWPRAARGPRASVQLDLEELEELNRALSRAARAAESVRSTTQQMTRSLSAELRQARGLRGSCLF
ncbi:microtubule organization protein AKNA [Sorex araneus]|uniref:microtubule organization protein AKNA n=1 Tax=Sorex araneus TaxID=42254 RepID=UPI00243406BF|nr:microtubule organization protein AKNA [Sorex araneus]XP_054975536.1 microtubule organization protein AKNA [Sorex araneus]XP_054975543.1 microtubule organization protein AKNA [Sorex araneus]